MTLDNLAGFGWERPFLGVAMWVFMLGFLGFPLTGGFVGKFYAFAAAYEHGWWWLIVVGVAGTVVSAAYYLAVVRAMYMRDAPSCGSPRPAARRRATLRSSRRSPSAWSVTVGSFFAVQPLIDVARAAARALPALRAARLGLGRPELARAAAACGASASSALSAKSASAREERPRPRACGTPWTALLRSAQESDEQRDDEAREDRLQRATAVVAARRGSRRRPRVAATAAKRHRREQRVAGEPVRPVESALAAATTRSAGSRRRPTGR